MVLTKLSISILFTGILSCIFSCSPKNISSNYYYQNEKVLDKIEETYKKINEQNSFNIAFTDRNLDIISLQIITDTLNYIYQFEIKETRLSDTLVAYHFNASKVVELIQLMRSIRCIWVNKFDYYVDEKKNSMIFMSIKPVALKTPFAYQKYYTLAYFPQPQYYDSAGHLLDKRKLKSLRKISGEIFNRINARVCYTISVDFR